MVFALGARQHLFDVVEAADEARPEIEAFGAEGPFPFLRLTRIETGSKDVVDDRLERVSALFHFLFEPHCDVFVQCQRGAHTLMVSV